MFQEACVCFLYLAISHAWKYVYIFIFFIWPEVLHYLCIKSLLDIKTGVSTIVETCVRGMNLCNAAAYVSPSVNTVYVWYKRTVLVCCKHSFHPV